MLIHVTPRALLNEVDDNCSLVDIVVPELGLKLQEGKDVVCRRPYPNKRYLVACRKRGRKAWEGLLIQVPSKLAAFKVISRWSVNAERVLTHTVEYELLDHDFDAVSDNPSYWSATYQGGFEDRWPRQYSGISPVKIQPKMTMPNIELGDPQSLNETLSIPTVPLERMYYGQPLANNRMPPVSDAFIVKLEQ